MPNRINEQIPALLALAHDRSEAARLQLAEKLADLFLDEATSLNPQEEFALQELINQLIETSAPDLRRKLAEKLAAQTKLPRPVVLQLAQSTIDVAAGVLQTSKTLRDEDLILVVQTQTRSHACAVANRQNINEAVADALVMTGDSRVMQIVAENLGATLSPRALTALADAGRLTESLQRPLLYRPEMTSELALKLYWWVAPDLRRYALQRFGVTAGQVDHSLAKTIDERLKHTLLERTDDGAMGRLADWFENGDRVNAHVLRQILRLGHFRLFAILMSRLTKLDVALIDIIVADKGGSLMAVLARALDIDKAIFASIFLLARGARTDDQVVHPRELSHALAAFDRLRLGMANNLLQSWRENPAYLLQRAENEIGIEA